MKTGDVVVTIPARQFQAWKDEGDLPGEPWSGNISWFKLGQRPKRTKLGDRVYIVCRNHLIGYAPLTDVREHNGCFYLIREGNAVAVTIDQEIKGFQGFRYRWWDRDKERPFPDWKNI